MRLSGRGGFRRIARKGRLCRLAIVIVCDTLMSLTALCLPKGRTSLYTSLIQIVRSSIASFLASADVPHHTHLHKSPQTPKPHSPSINLNTLLLQLPFSLPNLLHQLLVRIRHIIERENAVAEFEKEEGAEGDEGPEGKLHSKTMLANMYEVWILLWEGKGGGARLVRFQIGSLLGRVQGRCSR